MAGMLCVLMSAKNAFIVRRLDFVTRRVYELLCSSDLEALSFFCGMSRERVFLLTFCVILLGVWGLGMHGRKRKM